MVEAAAIRQVSDLQSKGADIVAEAKKHPVELRRYSETVAFVVSPEQHERYRQLEEAARRALWAFSIQRALRNIEQGRFTVWDEAAAARLQAMFPEA